MKKKKKKALTVFLIVCKDKNDHGKGRWLSRDLAGRYFQKEDAQKAANRRIQERPSANVTWVIAKFKEVV